MALQYFTFILRFVLGSVFVISGFAKISYPGSKALDPQIAEAFSVFTFIPLDFIHLYVELLPWIELFLALAIIFGIFLRFFLVLSFCVIASFLLANGLFAYYGFSSHCSNCFGKLIELNLPEAIAIDLLMLFIAAWIFFKGKNNISVDNYLCKVGFFKKIKKMICLKLHFRSSLSFLFRFVLAAILVLGALNMFLCPWSKVLDPLMVESLSVFTFIPFGVIHLYGQLLPWISFAVSFSLFLISLKG